VRESWVKQKMSLDITSPFIYNESTLQDQEIIYDFHAQLQGTGSRSEVFRYD